MADVTAPRGSVGAAIVLMLGAYGLFSVVDGTTKWLLEVGYAALFLAFLRYAVHLVITSTRAVIQGRNPFLYSRNALGLIFVRAALLATATLVNFQALQYLSLTVTSAIMFSAPVIVCALAGPVLGERVGPWRWGAVAIGLAGVLTIIRPLGEDFHWATVWMLYPATAMALYSILTRKLAADVAPNDLQLMIGIVGTMLLFPLALTSWSAPESAGHLVLLLAIGSFAWAGHEVLIRAHTWAGASVLMPFSYSYLIYMAIIGYVVFDDDIDRWTGLGAVMIVTGGLIIWWRETQVKPDEKKDRPRAALE